LKSDCASFILPAQKNSYEERMSAVTGVVRNGANNIHHIQQTRMQKIRQYIPSCSSLIKITCVALAIIALGQGWINARADCEDWIRTSSVFVAQTNNWRTIYEETEKRYRIIAKFKCDLEFNPSSSQDTEIAEFCKGALYPKDKIPFIWASQFPEDNYLLGIKHLAATAEITQIKLESSKNTAKRKISQKPLLCFVSIKQSKEKEVFPIPRRHVR
jgi:hypothetical protein